MDRYCVSSLWSRGVIDKDEAIFLLDCLREGGIPGCFGKNGVKDICQSNRWVRGYRLCRICEKVAEYDIKNREEVS